MYRACATLAVLALSAGAAWADTVSPSPAAIAVTVYRDGGLSTDELTQRENIWIANRGLAMIVETREVDLPAGPSVIRFQGVASTMVPQTATIDGLPEGVLERNLDYDLLSPGSLLAKSIGETVHVIRTDPKTGKATEIAAIVRSGPDGVMLDIGGKLEALHCSGLPERLVFDKALDGLTDTPTLSVRTNAPAAGHYKIQLSYLATGIAWSADYVAHVNSGGRSLDLAAWLTLANFSATGFQHIPIYAVAGHYNATGDDRTVVVFPPRLEAACWPTTFNWWTRHRLRRAEDIQSVPVAVTALSGADLRAKQVTGRRVADPEALGDYKLYKLPEPTDMPARETKQVQFLDLHDVPFTRVYRYRILPDTLADGGAKLVLKLHNSADAGLGKPLPEGLVAVSETGAAGTPVFVGQSPLDDTPVGLPVEIAMGETFSVSVKMRLIDSKETGTDDEKRFQRGLAFEVANTRAEPIAFELLQAAAGAKVLSESRPHRTENGFLVWPLTLTPGEHAWIRLGLDTPD